MKLGDAIAVIAQPIARGLDATIGPSGMGFYRTPIETCTGCVGRQETLNRWGDKFYDQFVFRKNNQTGDSKMQYIITISKMVEADSPEEAAAMIKDAQTVSFSVNPRPQPQQIAQQQAPAPARIAPGRPAPTSR